MGLGKELNNRDGKTLCLLLLKLGSLILNIFGLVVAIFVCLSLILLLLRQFRFRPQSNKVNVLVRLRVTVFPVILLIHLNQISVGILFGPVVPPSCPCHSPRVHPWPYEPRDLIPAGGMRWAVPVNMTRHDQVKREKGGIDPPNDPSARAMRVCGLGCPRRQGNGNRRGGGSAESATSPRRNL